MAYVKVTLRNYSFWFLLCAIAVVSCKKKSNNPARTTATYTISYTGGMYTGETIFFNSTAPAGGTYTWSFGDGASATEAAPPHSYAASGTYSVTLIYNGTDTAHTTIHIGSDSITQAKLSGSRTWHHSRHYYAEGMMDSTFLMSDTTLSTNLVDSTTVVFGNDTLNLLDVSSSYRHFQHIFYIVSGGVHYMTLSGSDFYYFPSNDSISYQYFDHISAASNTTDYYRNP